MEMRGLSTRCDVSGSRSYAPITGADPEGYLFRVGAMSNQGGIYGKEWSKGEVLILFAESTENQANTAELIGQGFEYLEFAP